MRRHPTRFDDYGQPHLKGDGPSGAYVARLPPEHRDALRLALHKRLQANRPDRGSRYSRKLWPCAASCRRHNEIRTRALQEVETAAQALGVQLHPVAVRDFDTFDQAFAAMAEALITQLSAGFVSRCTQIVDLAARMQ